MRWSASGSRMASLVMLDPFSGSDRARLSQGQASVHHLIPMIRANGGGRARRRRGSDDRRPVAQRGSRPDLAQLEQFESEGFNLAHNGEDGGLVFQAAGENGLASLQLWLHRGERRQCGRSELPLDPDPVEPGLIEHRLIVHADLVSGPRRNLMIWSADGAGAYPGVRDSPRESSRSSRACCTADERSWAPSFA